MPPTSGSHCFLIVRATDGACRSAVSSCCTTSRSPGAADRRPALGKDTPEGRSVQPDATGIAMDSPAHLNRRDIFKQNRAAALAEWRQLAA